MDAIGQNAATEAKKRIFGGMPGLGEPAAPGNAVRLKIISVCAVVFFACVSGAQLYFVSPQGDDVNPGTLDKPFATLQHAQQAARQKRGNVCLRGGTYYLPDTLVFTAQDSGTKDAPVVFQNYHGEQTADTAALLRQAPASSAGSAVKIGISRNQKEIIVQPVP